MSDANVVNLTDNQAVVIRKEYGACYAVDLRIRFSKEVGWIIERQWADGPFVEWVVIPGQLDEEQS